MESLVYTQGKKVKWGLGNDSVSEQQKLCVFCRNNYISSYFSKYNIIFILQAKAGPIDIGYYS